nr:NUDIX domain-containing protein [uncultured Pseudomonas sp.]
MSAACPLADAGRLLLVRKGYTQALMLPGGKAEPDETAIAALTRELEEELNLSLVSRHESFVAFRGWGRAALRFSRD